MHCGLLCKECHGQCVNPPTEKTQLFIECEVCRGSGGECSNCDDGYHVITQCPQKEIGNKMLRQVNLAVHAMQGLLPEAGGIQDQEPRFLDFLGKFRRDVNLIEEDRRKRRGKRS